MFTSKLKATDSIQGLTLSQRNQLLMDYAPLVNVIARRIASRLPACVELDDLVSSGFLGLIEAIEKFDPMKDVQFKTYGEWRIKGAILDELRALDIVPRSVRDKIKIHERTMSKLEQTLGRSAEHGERAKAMQMSDRDYQNFKEDITTPVQFSMTHVHPKSSQPAEIDLPAHDDELRSDLQILHTELRDQLKEAISDLPDQQAIVVTLYFYDGMTLKECADLLNLSESRVSQIRTLALKRLKRKLLNAKIEG